MWFVQLIQIYTKYFTFSRNVLFILLKKLERIKIVLMIFSPILNIIALVIFKFIDFLFQIDVSQI